MSSIAKQFNYLLKKAGLPSVRRCIGRVFAFTWSDSNFTYKVIARIDGLEFAGCSPDWPDMFTVIASLKRRCDTANGPPTICFFDGYTSSDGTLQSPEWMIRFGDRVTGEQGDSGPLQNYNGQFELL